MKVLTVSLTERGRALAQRLPFDRRHGEVGRRLRERWSEEDAFVLVLATGAAVRLIAPLLDSKERDPAVVCLDDSARFCVALVGGHGRRAPSGERLGANDLARQVAGLTGAQPVVTTASEAAGLPPLDGLAGFGTSGDVAGVSAALLAGSQPAIDNPMGWPLPPGLPGGPGPGRVVVSDRVVPRRRGRAVLHPPSLVVGVGTSSAAPAAEVADLVRSCLEGAGLAAASVSEVATIDRRAGEPSICGLGWPVRAFRAAELAAVEVPSPSEAVREAVGTPSVAEAAALLGAGPEAHLVAPKRASRHATVALARRRFPVGSLAVVGLGPGGPLHRTPAAETAVRCAESVIGYGPYLDQCADLLGPAQAVVRSPIGAELERATRAVSEAEEGRRVALVCSGDAGTYAMASLVLELGSRLQIEVVPGIPAAVAAASLLGAPLGHDHASISLSDLLTPWDVIERRLRAAAESDLVVALYNPRSEHRSWQLAEALRILGEHRPPATAVGVVADAARPGQRAVVTTLDEVDPSEASMTTCVVVGSTATSVIAGRMVTPRGYRR